MAQEARNLSRIGPLYESVARQQALFTRILPDRLRQCSIDYYLLYRMIDSIEDAPLVAGDKIALLRDVESDVREGLRGARKAVLECMHLSLAHKRLFVETEEILAFHDTLDASARRLIERTGRVMAGGMADYAEKRKLALLNNLPGPIANFSDLDDYCYYVAGCVGELNTDLFLEDAGIAGDRQRRLRRAGSQFGKYLQIINIIRDSCEDAEVGRSFFPRTIAGLEPREQVVEIVFFARSKEPDIREYLSVLSERNVRKYCTTLFDVARLHYEHFLSLKGELSGSIKPPAFRIFRVLPAELKVSFMRHKSAKVIRGFAP